MIHRARIALALGVPLLSGVVSIPAPSAQLTQEFIGRNEEGVLLHNAGDHRHGVSAEDVHVGHQSTPSRYARDLP